MNNDMNVITREAGAPLVPTSSNDNTTETNVTSTADDAALKAAFDEIDKAWNASDDLNQDSEDNGEKSNESSTSDNNNEDTSTSNTNTEGTSETEPSTTAVSNPSIDYKQLYEQLYEERKLQQQNLSLLSSRLSELSEQYQNLKREAHKDDTKTTSDNLEPEVQELFELYPDIAKAVDKMIEKKTAKAQQSIIEDAEAKSAVTRQAVQQVAQQQFVNQVLSVHPDLPQIMQTNALRNWVDGLDVVARAGAHQIMQYGSADDIIGLINLYKTSLNNAKKESPKSKDETLVDKLKNAMTVPSNKQEQQVTETNQPVTRSLQDEFNMLSREYEKSHGFRR